MVGERLSVSKCVVGKFAMEGFNLELRNDVEVKERVQVEISNRFAVLEIFNPRQSIRGNILSHLLCSENVSQECGELGEEFLRIDR